jgi:hypothetical protein
MPTLEALTELANTLRIVREGPPEVAAGRPVSARLAPPADALTITDFLAGPIDLKLVTKQLRFATPGPEPSLDPADIVAQIVGGIPLRLPVVGNLVGTEQLSGVPGTLTQLEGTLPIPVQAPVAVAVTWSVRDADGGPLAEGDSFLAPDGLASPQVVLVFAPEIVELTASAPPPVAVQRFLHARVRLSAGGVTTPDVDLPPVPLLIPALPVPTVLAMFRHTNFQPRSGDSQGAVLVLVPEDSPFRSLAALQPTLNTLEAAVSRLAGFARFASFLLGLRDLTAALSAQPHVQFRAQNGIGNLNDITLIHRNFPSLNDTEAEDELSSLIFVGPPGRKVECFVARSFRDGEGRFDLTIGRRVVEGGEQIGLELFTAIRSLHPATPATVPTGQELEIVRARGGGFGDELSSVRIG